MTAISFCIQLKTPSNIIFPSVGAKRGRKKDRQTCIGYHSEEGIG
jgi:hypothetical protein